MERRQEPRENRLMRGSVSFSNGASCIECIVREISDAGARLKLPNDRPRHGVLTLFVPLKGQSFTALVKWQKLDEVGIAFGNFASTDSRDTGDSDLLAHLIQLGAYADRLEFEIATLNHINGRLKKKSKTQAA